MQEGSSLIKIFYSYSHADETYRKKLDDHLAFLKHDSVAIWYDREIIAGSVLEESIQKELNEADIILLLVSSSFLSSFYCYEVEMKRAMERHETKDAIVVPVLLSDCVWQKAPFSKLLMTPNDAKPINNPKYWSTIDEAFTNVALEFEKTVNWVKQKKTNFELTQILTNNILPINKLKDFPKSRTYFNGREKEIQEFKSAIDNNNTFILVDGPGGIGKTQFISHCIEKFISSEKVIWFDCNLASQFDTLVSEAGYPELLKGESKSNREKFSAFKDKIQESELFLFLDNFQETNTNSVFKDFLYFVQDHLNKGAVIVLDRDNITNVDLQPKRISIRGLKENKLKYAKTLIENRYKNEVEIDDIDLENLCEQLHGYPLAIDFAILLLSQGETAANIISKITESDEVETISKRLLNDIFKRNDATVEEREFIKQFSVFTGSVSEQIVEHVISKDLSSVAPKRLQRKNLLNITNGSYEIHPLVREFCYKECEIKEDVHSKIANYYITTRTELLNPALEEQIFYHLSKSNQWEKIETQIEENGRKFISYGQLGLVKELLNNLKKLGIEKPIFNIIYGDIALITGNWEEAKVNYNLARTNVSDTKIKAEGMIKYAEMLHRKGHVREALPLYEEAVQFTTKSNLQKEQARALNDIGLVFEVFGDYEKAHSKFTESLKIRNQILDNEGIAATLNNIGNLFDSKEDLNNALKYHNKSLIISKSIGNELEIARSLGQIGAVYNQKNEKQKALEFLNQSLNIANRIGDKESIANILNLIGILYINETEKALEYFNHSLGIQKEIGSKKGMSNSLGNIGLVYTKKRKFDIAISFQTECKNILCEIGDRFGMATALNNIGSIYFEENNEDEKFGITYFFESLALFKILGASLKYMNSLSWIISIRDEKKIDYELFKKFTNEAYGKLTPDLQKHIPLREILKEQIVREEPKVGRNDKCPCGSDKKYKQCHGKG